MPVLGQYRFRVELNALHREPFVAHAHDLAVLGPRSDLQTVGRVRRPDRKRVVTRRLEWIRQSTEHADPLVMNHRRLAVHDALRAHHAPAERFTDRLMTETYAEDRRAAGKALDRLE